MDNNGTQGNSECKNCGGCGCGMGASMCGRGHWAHILIKILIAIFIFWCGVQFGELRGMLHSGYGYGTMSSYGSGRY